MYFYFSLLINLLNFDTFVSQNLPYRLVVKTFTLILFITSISFNLSAQAPSFGKAKKHLKDLYQAYPSTFYCNCKIKWLSKKKLIPDWQSCGFKPRKQKKRASRIEWEHVVAAWEFGHQLQCWQDGGRKNCRKNNEQFKLMEGDLHNLVPAIGEVNGDRSNYKFTMITGEERVYGQCDAEVNFKQKIFEPKDDIRGNIARSYFYFAKQYGLRISKKQKQLYQAWHKLDPVDKQECDITQAKAKIQGIDNRFVTDECPNL